MKTTIRQYDWPEIAQLIEAEEKREGNKIIKVPELVVSDDGYFVRFETERLGTTPEVAEIIAPKVKVKNEGKRQAMTPERLAKMSTARARKRQERETAKQETVSLVEVIAPRTAEQDALLEKIAQVEAKANGHAPLVETLEVVAATESPFH
jgi:hypothetical protein